MIICGVTKDGVHQNNPHALEDKKGTRWFKYDRDYLCVNKSQFVPVIFEPPCNIQIETSNIQTQLCHVSKNIFRSSKAYLNLEICTFETVLQNREQ
jgi:hypothetical protein